MPRTCTLRTRFGSYPDLERAVALLVRSDGRLFVPLSPEQVAQGETLKVVFTTENGAVSVNRLGAVESTAPDRALSGGERGVVVRLRAWKSPPAPPPVPESLSSFDERPNPLAGMDTNMVSLLVECTLTESNEEVGRSYDDIPCVDLAAEAEDPDELEPTRRVSAKVISPLMIEWENGEREIIDDPVLGDGPLPRLARHRSVASWVLMGGALGLAAAAVLVLAPSWTRLLLRHPLAAVMKGLTGSIIALDAHDALPPALLLAGAIPPLIPSASPDQSATAEPTEEAPAPEVTACQVRLSSRPSRVEIWAGRRHLGRTPSDRLSVPCGAELLFKRPRYQTAVVRAPAQPSAAVEVLAVNLVRPPAQLLVTSDPEGAEVRLHGHTVGHTPATIAVSRYETLSVEVRAPHFRGWKKRLYVRSAELAVRAELAGGDRASRPRGGRSPRGREPRPGASSPAAARR